MFMACAQLFRPPESSTKHWRNSAAQLKQKHSHCPSRTALSGLTTGLALLHAKQAAAEIKGDNAGH
jgi:hypothetical protein